VLAGYDIRHDKFDDQLGDTLAITSGTVSATMNWNAFLGLTSDTGQNGDTTSIGYDPNSGRPMSVTSPFGASTRYTYNDTALPPTHTATINGRWNKTTMDRFGRTIQTDSGDTQTRSTVQVQYAACGCSVPTEV